MNAKLYDGTKCLGIITHARFNPLRTEVTGEFEGELDFKVGAQPRPLQVWVNNKQVLIRAWISKFPEHFREIIVTGTRTQDGRTDDKKKKKTFE